MATLANTYQAIGNLNLWLKQRSGEPMMLSDIPNIIPLRWSYFQANWQFIKSGLTSLVPSYFNPAYLTSMISQFDTFMTLHTYVPSTVNPFSNASVFYQYYAIFDNIQIQSINLTNQEKLILSNAILAVQQYSKNDFLNIKNTITSYRDAYADTVGLDDPTYNETYNRQAIAPQRSATLLDVDFLLTLQNSITSVNFILSNLFQVDAVLDHFALARTNANNPEIAIGSYSSGYLVKMNNGDNLEALATKYLGDPNKWLDIAIANGLKPPYIDEIGMAIPLLSNGDGNQINLAETNQQGDYNIDLIYVNQPVFLQSTTQVIPDQRTITSIKVVPVSGEIIITLSGSSNLNEYTTAANASIRVYQIGTINSSFYVLIPSTNPLDDDRSEEVPWFLTSTPDDEKRAKVDLAIDANGEINFTTNGDLVLSYGLDNAIQAMRLKIITELGTLRYHPNFGLVSVVGKVNADLDAIKSLIAESLIAQVSADSRFDRIESLDVEYVVGAGANGTAVMAITMVVRLAGGNKTIPISFTVNNPAA
jgi:hypothetical protein